MSTRKLLAVAAIAAALEFAGSAQASPAQTPTTEAEQTSVRVSVADLDLHKDAGAKVALRRIHQAAVAICGDEPQSAGLARYGLYRGCVTAVVRDAVAPRGSVLASAPGGESSSLEAVLAASR